jgi:hypothetical protein
MSDADTSPVERENFLYERILGAASTAKTFYPFDACVEQPLAILQKFVCDLERLGTVDAALTRQPYLVSLVKETIEKCADPHIEPDRKMQLLFMVYVHACVASHALQDRYGVKSRYWSKYPSRFEAVVHGWTLGWDQDADGKSEAIRAKIVSFYAERGIRVQAEESSG